MWEQLPGGLAAGGVDFSLRGQEARRANRQRLTLNVLYSISRIPLIFPLYYSKSYQRIYGKD